MEKQSRINHYLTNQTDKFDLAYKTIYNSQKEFANFLYKLISRDKQIIEIYKKLQTADKFEKDILRKNLYTCCRKLLGKDSFHLHFHLKNNVSFLRMHRPKRFGDTLTNIRPMVAYVNKMGIPIDGFEQGRIYNGYRYVYPIVSQKKHLGSMEVSFGMDFFLSKLMKQYGVIGNFLANKSSIESKVFKVEIKNYIQSYYSGYLFDKKVLKVLKKYTKLDIKELKPSSKTRKKIMALVNKKTKGTIYCDKSKNTITIIPVFDPITNKMEGFLNIRDRSLFIPTIHTNFIMLISAISIFLLSILLFIYRQIEMKNSIEKERKLIQNVLNSIVNITFVTDFKKLQYANSAFLHFFNISSIEEFNAIHPKITEIFLPWGDYLQINEKQDSEDFATLIIHTDELRRKIIMFDTKFNLTAFSITISKLNYQNHKSYLLTLTDITEQEIQQKQIEHKAYFDELTNIYNRNKFNELFQIELRKAKRYKIPFCIAILDIDHFKMFNDTYGHLIGDEILIMLAAGVSKNIRNTDTFARWGGEEFVILFSDTTIEKAFYICEELREKIERIEHKVAGHISVSFGVTQYHEKDTLQTIFKRCDEALYEAKNAGRNRVVSKRGIEI